KYDRLVRIGQAIVSEKRTGRPADIYFNGGDWWKVKTDNLRHTIKETDCELALLSLHPNADVLRGPRTGELRPDVVMIMPDQYRFMIEVDCGTMSEKQVTDRWQKYESHRGAVLIAVAPKYEDAMTRIKKLMTWADEGTSNFNDKAYYAPLSDIITSPGGAIWM